eukprot:11576429-Alexandrium_andersonii.AAC.1
MYSDTQRVSGVAGHPNVHGHGAQYQTEAGPRHAAMPRTGYGFVPGPNWRRNLKLVIERRPQSWNALVAEAVG